MKRWLLALMAASLLLTACSGTTSAAAEVASLDDITAADEGDQSEAETPVDTEAALLAMAQCMRDEGVDVSDPEVDADGNVLPPRPTDTENLDREALRSARETCSEYLEGVELGFRDVDVTELEDNLLEYATCMRDNGFDMPDPDLSGVGTGPGQGGGIFGQIDQSDPDFAAAQEVCQDILGDIGLRAGGRGAGAGPGGGS